MKIRSYINVQIEFVEELSEEDYKMFNSNEAKNKAKQTIEELLKNNLRANKILVKSYRLEKEKENES